MKKDNGIHQKINNLRIRIKKIRKEKNALLEELSIVEKEISKIKSEHEAEQIKKIKASLLD